jgi:signal transduction histidine kinase
MLYPDTLIPIGFIIFSGLANLVIGIYIYLFAYKLSNKNYTSAKYLSYIGFWVFNWILWITLQTSYIIPVENIYVLYISNILIYLSFINIIKNFIFFAISFSSNTKTTKKYKFLYYPYIFIVGLILIPQIGILRLDPAEPISYNSISYYILFVYLISHFLLYIRILAHKHSIVVTKNEKNNIELFLILPSLAIILSLMTNIIIPFFYKNTSFIYYGPVFMMILVITVLTGILKYKLFYIKLPIISLLVTLIITLILLIMRFSIIDNRIIGQVQANMLFIFMFSFIYIFLTREVYVGLKKQLLLDAKKKELEVALDSKNNFLKNSSHQFRTPLTVILGYLGMIIHKENPKYEINKVALDDLNKTYISAKNLNDIINDVLAANDVNAGKFGLSIIDTNVDLKQLIQSIVNEKKELLSSKSTKVSLKIRGKNITATIDRAKIKEAINNIFDNAVFYGKGKIDILIDYSLSDFFAISIKDNGVGITVADSKKIWKKFDRGKKSPQINPNGSGLGLYLAKQIISQHGGDISVKSEGFNKGSEFTLTIPKYINPLSNKSKP